MTVARILPGAMIHVWDHLVITLRDGERETAFLSWYAITWSKSLGAGNVALLEVPERSIAMTLTDDRGLGERQQARLRGMGTERAALADDPVRATFERSPFGSGGFGVRIVTSTTTIEARWLDVSEPFWVDGSFGGFSPTEDIWAAFVEAPRARLTIDGMAVAGVPFVDEVWVPKLGRSLSSAHAAFSEVRVAPVASR
jgi:hypothetical protein